MKISDLYKEYLDKIVIVRMNDDIKFSAKLIMFSDDGEYGYFENSYKTIFKHKLENITFIREVAK